MLGYLLVAGVVGLALGAVLVATGQWLADRRRVARDPFGAPAHPTHVSIACTACHDTFPDRQSAEEHLAEEHGMVLEGDEADDVLVEAEVEGGN
jgi:hypothetical protein